MAPSYPLRLVHHPERNTIDREVGQNAIPLTTSLRRHHRNSEARSSNLAANASRFNSPRITQLPPAYSAGNSFPQTNAAANTPSNQTTGTPLTVVPPTGNANERPPLQRPNSGLLSSGMFKSLGLIIMIGALSMDMSREPRPTHVGMEPYPLIGKAALRYQNNPKYAIIAVPIDRWRTAYWLRVWIMVMLWSALVANSFLQIIRERSGRRWCELKEGMDLENGTGTWQRRVAKDALALWKNDAKWERRVALSLATFGAMMTFILLAISSQFK